MSGLAGDSSPALAFGAPAGGDGQRGGRRGAAGPVEVSQIRGKARIVQPPAIEPSDELVESRGVYAARVRRGGLRDELGRSLRAAAVRSGKRAACAAAANTV